MNMFLKKQISEYIERVYITSDNLNAEHMTKISGGVTSVLSNTNHPFYTTTSIDILLKNMDDTFSTHLLKLIDRKGKTDVEIYKKAFIDRKLFSKIRKKDYRPKKETAILLALALELSLDETIDLLMRAGYTLSHSNKFDIIIEYFIKECIYDVFEINDMLDHFEQKLFHI